MRTHPIVEYYQALRDSAPCLSRAATLPKGTKLGLGKRRAPGNTIILSQPYRRRVSTDRLNREGSQLAASLEGEPGPTPAGKTLPHSFPETSRFRRERARDGGPHREPPTPRSTRLLATGHPHLARPSKESQGCCWWVESSKYHAYCRRAAAEVAATSTSIIYICVCRTMFVCMALTTGQGCQSCSWSAAEQGK